MTETDEFMRTARESSEDKYDLEPTSGISSPASNGKPLGRDAILGASDLTTERVDVPEWGGYVYVRQLTAGERDQVEASLIDKNGNTDPARLKDFRGRMAALAIVDETGARVFADKDMHALSKKSAIAMDRVLDVTRRLSGMTDEAEREIAAKSGAVQGDGSLTE